MKTELRIGNYFLDSGGKALRLDWMEFIGDGDYKLCQSMTIEGMPVHPLTEYASTARGVPLDEEWLKKFGFEKAKDGCLMLRYDSEPIIGYWTVDGAVSYRGAFVIPLIKYVHQLQNLFFSLTGTELELKHQ